MTACAVSKHQESSPKPTLPEARGGFDLLQDVESIALAVEDPLIDLETISSVSSFWDTPDYQRRVDGVRDDEPFSLTYLDLSG